MALHLHGSDNSEETTGSTGPDQDPEALEDTCRKVRGGSLPDLPGAWGLLSSPFPSLRLHSPGTRFTLGTAGLGVAEREKSLSWGLWPSNRGQAANSTE